MNFTTFIKYFIFHEHCVKKIIIWDHVLWDSLEIWVIFTQKWITCSSLLKANSGVFLFLFFPADPNNTSVESGFPVVILVKHKAEQMLTQVSATWQAIVDLAGASRLGNWRKTFHPSWRQDYESVNQHETQVYYRHHWEWHGELWDSHPSGTSLRSQQVNYGPKLLCQLVRCCNWTPVQVGTALINIRQLGDLADTLP